MKGIISAIETKFKKKLGGAGMKLQNTKINERISKENVWKRKKGLWLNHDKTKVNQS